MPRYGWRKSYAKICSIDGCNDAVKYKGMCGMHYKRQWRHGDVNISLIPHEFTDRHVCDVDSCQELQYASNSPYCKKHYLRLYRFGRLHNIKNGYGESKVRHKAAGGYWEINDEEGRKIYEHVWLAEKALGKKLPSGAIVHHMNKDRGDNDTPFNLIVCPNQAYHLLLHKRMRDLGYIGDLLETNETWRDPKAG